MAAVAILDVEGAPEFLQRDGIVSKFKKMKNIVKSGVSGTRHDEGTLSGSEGAIRLILVTFLKIDVTFFGVLELHW
jgi:hypothetical protein